MNVVNIVVHEQLVNTNMNTAGQKAPRLVEHKVYTKIYS